ncbi:19850_t:CDS:1, partial [Funneliformis geosporum]
TARTQIYAEIKPYLTDISDEYLRVRTSKARKINKLFGFEYDPITLKKVNGIGWHMVQRITCNADKISRLTNPQIEYIIEQVKSKTTTSPVNEIASTIANTSANDPSDDNFSDTSDITDYFKEEGAIEEDSKKSGIIAKADNDDDV